MAAPITIATMADPVSTAAVAQAMREFYPQYYAGFGHVAATQILESPGGTLYLWLDRGSGFAHLPSGYRTQEGDGGTLPANYQTDPLPANGIAALDALRAGQNLWPEKIAAQLARILERRQADNRLAGDISGDLLAVWLNRPAWIGLQELARPLEYLLQNYPAMGWSTKINEAAEPLGPGDQIILRPSEKLAVAGNFSYWWISDVSGQAPRTSMLRRVPLVKNTMGGCNISPSAFRRLMLTWDFAGCSAAVPDGSNRLNSHIVNIAAASALSHYHPRKALGTLPEGPTPPASSPAAAGKYCGLPQCEIYLVLNAADHGIVPHSSNPHVLIFPDLDNLKISQSHKLSPGQLVFIPPGVGHRGMDILVNVIALPGFKPRNEIPLDAAIKKAGGIFNPAMA